MRPLNTNCLPLFGCLLLLLVTLPVAAGQFGVSPIRLDLDRGAKSGAIAVTNDDEAAPLRVQLRLFKWVQDANGKDEYRESEDLLYFPRLMSLEKGEQKLVRVGLRTPALEREKTYRLFVEELPAAPSDGAPAGARVAIAVRFGIPVFVKPLKEEVAGEIGRLDLVKGVLRATVHNGGNTHFTIKSVMVSSDTGFSMEAAGWYLLAGASREHAIALPAEACAKLKRLDVTIKTDKLELKSALDVTASMCRP